MDSNRKFKFKLASHLGMTVRELEKTMLNKEFVEWQEYAKEEPLLADRVEMMLAQVASTQSGKSPIEHMVSIANETKKDILHKQMEQDMINAFKGQ